LISSPELFKLGLLTKGIPIIEQLERWGLDIHAKVSNGCGFTYLFLKKDVLAALGYSKWVRLTFSVPSANKPTLSLLREQGLVTESCNGRLFATRASLLACLAQQIKPKRGPARPSAPAPELIARASDDAILEEMERFFSGQKILWQEMQLIRKGQEAIMKAFEINPAAATPQQPRDAN
jgi:hypothetical protein